MKNCYFYLDGLPLVILAIIVFFLSVFLIVWGTHYIDLIRENEKLKQSNRICRADLCAAEMELQGIRMRQGYGQSRTPVHTKEIATGVSHLRNDEETECPYKVEPGSGTPSVTHSRATFPKGEGREIASMMSGSTPTSNDA